MQTPGQLSGGSFRVDEAAAVAVVPADAIALGVIASILALAILSRTLLSHVGSWDVAEFQTVPDILGICHPTGYPLYTLLGKLWLLVLPAGSVAWKMSLLSAVCTALAAGVLTGTCRFFAPRPVALATGFTFAFAYYQWHVASHADPHSLNALFAALIVAAGLAWEARPGPGPLRALAAACGFAVANHLLALMLFPAVALVVGLKARQARLTPGAIAAAVGLFSLGLATFAYLPLRAALHPPLDYAHPTTPDRFWYLVLGQQFNGGMGFLTWQGIAHFLSQLPGYPGFLAGWYQPAGAGAILALALVGLACLAVLRPQAAVFLVAAFVVPLYAAMNYSNAELFRYYFPSHVVLLLLAATGAGFVIRLASRLAGRLRPQGATLVATLAGLACLALPVTEARASMPRIRSEIAGDSSERFMDAVYAAAPKNAVILSWWDTSTTLWYGRWVLGMRPDVTIVDDRNLYDDGWDGNFLNVVHADLGKRPVVTLYLEHDLRRLRAAGYRLLDFSDPSYGHLGYHVEAAPPSAGAPVAPPIDPPHGEDFHFGQLPGGRWRRRPSMIVKKAR